MNIIVAKPGWETPRSIAKSLKVRRITDVRLLRANRPSKIINWGRVDFAAPRATTVLNRPEIIRNSRNKLSQYRTLAERQVPLPEWTQDPQTALGWAQEGKTVYGRETLSGQMGRGIRLFGPKFRIPRLEELRGTRLFTKHWKCDYEARYHVFRGEVIDIQRKMRVNADRFGALPEAAQKASYWIRNHTNGWVFGREGAVPHAAGSRAAVAAVNALGLDFGAVDVRIRGQRAVVLEVNSAPGLEGTTREIYGKKIKEFFRV